MKTDTEELLNRLEVPIRRLLEAQGFNCEQKDVKAFLDDFLGEIFLEVAAMSSFLVKNNLDNSPQNIYRIMIVIGEAFKEYGEFELAGLKKSTM